MSEGEGLQKPKNATAKSNANLFQQVLTNRDDVLAKLCFPLKSIHTMPAQAPQQAAYFILKTNKMYDSIFIVIDLR